MLSLTKEAIASKKNIFALVAYEGTRYLGWQKTATGPSIQESLEKALATLLKIESKAEAASRTDAGVHAQGQIVNFFVDQEVSLEKLLRGMNALLPKDIVVRHLEEARPSFHPTLEAKAKEYHYQVVFGPSGTPFLRDFAWHYPSDLQLSAMEEAASHLLGRHDFSSFCNDRSLLDIDPVCEIRSIVFEEFAPDALKIRITGNRFLYKMVRNIVGTLVYVGSGKLNQSDLPLILKAKDRTLSGMTAPAKGLILHKVFYDLPQ